MQHAINEASVMHNESRILARRDLRREHRPTRDDMLNFFRGVHIKPAVGAVCRGNCIYCDNDSGGGGGDDGGIG